MIVILIGTIALGMSAPLISRQLKNETLTNTQMQVLQRQIDGLKKSGGSAASGAIMFFRGDCPDKWKDLSSEFSGRYIRISGTNDICDKDGENADGSCKNTIASETLVPTKLQGEMSRRVWGALPGSDADTSMDYEWYGVYSDHNTKTDYYVKALEEHGILGGAFKFLTQEDVKTDRYALPENWKTRGWRRFSAKTNPFYNYSYIHGFYYDKYIVYVDPAGASAAGPAWSTAQTFINTFDNKRQIPTGNENRPKTVVLRACEAP